MPHVKHVVLMRLPNDTPEETIAHLMRELSALQDKIPGLLDFSGGRYSSPEGLHQGFTHAFSMTFSSPRSRDTYLTHPDHEAAKSLILPLLPSGLSDVIAFDWEEADTSE